jgi:DNA-binding ferritin-like protein
MKTRADEIKAEMKKLDALIARGVSMAESSDDAETAQLWHDYAKQLEKRKAKLKEELEREEARLVRPQPQSVKAGPFDI